MAAEGADWEDRQDKGDSLDSAEGDEDLTTKHLRPKPKPKDGRRRAPNMTEKLAATLLHLKRGNGEPLVPADLREKSAEEICAAFDFDRLRAA